GLDRRGTQDAMTLPPAISLALAATGSNPRGLASEARGAGHEIFLEVPLEPLGDPVDYPDSHMLRVEDAVRENVDRLEWLMAQFNMYAGVAIIGGERFAADPGALAPVVAEFARRGLMLLDNGEATASAAADAA